MKKGSWIVNVECIIEKQLVVEGCDFDKASIDPWDYVVEEAELQMIDWDVIEVNPNKS